MTLRTHPSIRTCLDRIARLDQSIGAFLCIDPEAASRDMPPGPLAGMTLGIKDIIATSAFPTGYGSPIYDGFRTRCDAACVAQLEAAGAVGLGKTVTTEFAFFRPGGTRNPFDPSRTPGGSSSGSAAAVASGMVTLALASQTAASLTRPASYCGIVGFKPSWARYSLEGVKGLAPSFDTLGLLAGTIEDIAAADAVLAGPVPGVASTVARAPRRIGFCRTPWWDQGEPGMHRALDATVARLGQEVEVETVDLARLAHTAALHATIMGYEAAQALAWEHCAHRDRLSPQILGLIEAGRSTPRADYLAALAAAEQARRWIDTVFDRCDVLLAPAAPGEAPVGLHATGDPIFSRMWTLLRLPTITLPGLVGEAGLPIGLQLLGRFGSDLDLLDHAAWTATRLPPRPLPALDP
jgi:Asp-tRNA(Asn)/Glu-tRNA(Gln) amidotransferase A subunit family amidase